MNATTESAAAYALCYKCHNRNVFANESTSKNTPGSFPYHFKHIVDKRTSCNVCHDPHGVSSTQGNSTNNSRLINFQTGVVTPSGGVLRFTKTANGGSCQLVSHGANHDPWTYP